MECAVNKDLLGAVNNFEFKFMNFLTKSVFFGGAIYSRHLGYGEFFGFIQGGNNLVEKCLTKRMERSKKSERKLEKA